MADTIQTLLVSLEARIAGYEREMKRAVGISNKSAKSIETRFQSMNRNLSNTAGQLSGSLARAFAGAAALRGAQQLIDASTRIENSLKVVGLAGEELTRVYDSLFASAQKNFAPVESLTTLFSRLGLAQKELGASTDDLLSFTDNVAVALRVQGTTAQEARGALIQLSQALGSGIVRAEEFNSVVEGAPSILRATAAGLTEAGGSVAKLRALVIDGEVSSKAFFDAFQAGSVILTDQLAGAEVTVSQGFIRLQNVLIDTAGKFDNATNASARIAGTLTQLANSIEGAGLAADANAPAINRFLDFISKAGNELGDSMFAGTVKEFEQIAGVVDSASQSFDRYGSSVTDAELATAQAEQALVNFGANTKGQFGELQPVVDDFIQQLLKGRGTALSASEAINEIGKAGDFGPLIGNLNSIVTALFAVRSEAVATGAAVAAAQRGETSSSNIAGQRSEQLANRPKPAVQPVTLKDYKIPKTPGSGGSSPGEKFSDTLDAQREENRLLAEKTALQATLNPLVNDYGYAVERLQIQQDLQSAATKAGIALTPALQATINDLATGYANATVEAAKLAEAQDGAREQMQEWADVGKSTVRSFIDDLIEGKDAADALANALGNIGSRLLDMGLNGLFGGGSGGGFGAIGKLFGFAKGGIAANGRPKMFANGGISRSAAIFGEAGPEAAVPLPDGRRIPVDLRMPTAGVGSGGSMTVSMPITIDATGADAAGLARVERKLGELQAGLPGKIKQVVQRRGKEMW